MRTQQLHRDQPDQPEAGDDDRLAECGLHQPYALQRDGAEHRERPPLRRTRRRVRVAHRFTGTLTISACAPV